MLTRPRLYRRAAARRLCTIVHGPYPVGEPRVTRQVRAALDAGYEVDVVAMRHAGEVSCELVEGARVLRLPVSHRRGRGAGRMLVEYVGFTLLAAMKVAALGLRRRYSVVQVNNPPDFLVFAAVAPRVLGSRVVFDVHDLSPDMFAMRFAQRRGARLADRVLRAVERQAAEFADAVVTVHEPYRRELIDRGVAAEKITVVMNSLDERLLPEQRDPAPAGGPFRVVYHGTLTPHYGVHLLLDAAAIVLERIPNLSVEIYGDGDALPDLRAQAVRLGLGDVVCFSGRYLDQAETLERVQGAAVGVVPNLPIRLNRFALSSKLFEYVALRIPVVSADLSTIATHFAPTEIAYFRAGDALSLANGILAVAREPEAASERVAAALRRYRDYGWCPNAERYVRALEAAHT